ncbi:MAG: hypothetical protein QOG85_2348 [Gaiellaceae bacterium]|jgi:hypothetical protein|nr:hypothetical protein [Gaiellaceae bacterium]
MSRRTPFGLTLIGSLAAALVVAGCGGGRIEARRPAGLTGPKGPPAGPTGPKGPPGGPIYGTGFEGETGEFGATGNIDEYCGCFRSVSRIGPILLSSAGLKAEANRIGQFYWAGPRPGFSYEFTRTKVGNAYVRYLPPGVEAGASGAQFLTVGTYPYTNAYEELKPNTSAPEMAVWAAPDHPKNALIAFRGDCPESGWVQDCGVPFEIEVYDSESAGSAKVAVESGQLRVTPVG